MLQDVLYQTLFPPSCSKSLSPIVSLAMVATSGCAMGLVVVKSQKGEGPYAYVLGAEAILLCLAKISCF
jgi:hypothetical protein